MPIADIFISSDEIFFGGTERRKNIECSMEENGDLTLVTKEVGKVAMGKWTSIAILM